MTGTSIRTPTTVTSAAPEDKPNSMVAVAIATSKWFDAPIIAAANAHLRGMKGKMFRPTLLLLASELEGGADGRETALAAVAELVHLASVVHDDSVDHSNVRRGQPTINALFSHQIAVIMGDYLFSKAVGELVRLGDLEALRAFTSASDDMTLGEMRQLSAYDALKIGRAHV